MTSFDTVDGTDCPIREPTPFSPHWFSHERNGAALRYEIAVSISSAHIFWTSGPWAPGRFTMLPFFAKNWRRNSGRLNSLWSVVAILTQILWLFFLLNILRWGSFHFYVHDTRQLMGKWSEFRYRRRFSSITCGCIANIFCSSQCSFFELEESPMFDIWKYSVKNKRASDL